MFLNNFLCSSTIKHYQTKNFYGTNQTKRFVILTTPYIYLIVIKGDGQPEKVLALYCTLKDTLLKTVGKIIFNLVYKYYIESSKNVSYIKVHSN